MTQFTPLHLAISNKLGWSDMLAEIAIPAIDRILSNFLWLISERHGVDATPEEAAAILLENYTADDIFGLLGCTDDPNYPGSKDEHDFINLRGEIEPFMFAGFDFVDAIREWD